MSPFQLIEIGDQLLLIMIDLFHQDHTMSERAAIKEKNNKYLSFVLYSMIVVLSHSCYLFHCSYQNQKYIRTVEVLYQFQLISFCLFDIPPISSLFPLSHHPPLHSTLTAACSDIARITRAQVPLPPPPVSVPSVDQRPVVTEWPQPPSIIFPRPSIVIVLSSCLLLFCRSVLTFKRYPLSCLGWFIFSVYFVLNCPINIISSTFVSKQHTCTCYYKTM